MTDPDIILQAYANAVEGSFSVFVENLILANSAQETATAEARFARGVAVARTARDRALVLLANPAPGPGPFVALAKPAVAKPKNKPKA